MRLLKICQYVSVRCHSTFKPHFTPVFGAQMAKHIKRNAVCDDHGKFKYDDVYKFAGGIHKQLIDKCGVDPSKTHRIAFLCPGDVRYVSSLWACWLGGNTAVPLYYQHPVNVMEYYVKDSQATAIVGTKEYEDKLKQLAKSSNVPLLLLDGCDELSTGPEWQENKKWNDLQGKDALMMYTSGTTGPPKGVVLTHSNIRFQTSQIIKTWQWTSDDVMLHALPLHHTHGIISGILTPLFSGASIKMLPKFDPNRVWRNLLADGVDPVSVFMGVPTMHIKLIEHYDKVLSKSKSKSEIHSAIKKNIRFIISGSASLPEPVFERMTDIFGIEPLERYGMTEVGVPLSNHLVGKRYSGCVGFPTIGTQIRIAQLEGRKIKKIISDGDFNGTKVFEPEESGDLLLKGQFVFNRYWNKKEKTTETFTEDGWFITGDEAKCVEDGVYKLLGRTSADIIKSGGYKISSLDVERYLLSHPSILECAVVGVKDATWGERVAAVIVLKPGCKEIAMEELRDWYKERMAHYAAPTIVKTLPQLSRNYLGKVNKKELKKEIFGENA